MSRFFFKKTKTSFVIVISFLTFVGKLQVTITNNYLAWVSGLPKGLGERRSEMGEGGGREEKGGPDTKPFSKSCDTSKIWMWQWLDNTQYPLTSLTTRVIGKKPLTFFIDALISCYRYVILLWTETQRGIQKGSRGLSQVLSWNVRVLVSQNRDKDDDISVSDI